MEQQLVLEGGGSLRLQTDAVRARIEARSGERAGVWKVQLRGERGGRYLLGTLAPEDGEMRLCRTVSLRELERAGCWPLSGGAVVEAYTEGRGTKEGEGWCRGADMTRLVEEPTLRGQIPRGMLMRPGEGGFSLAAPFRPELPFPIPALMCLARPQKWGEKIWLVWDFDSRGRPVCPNREE